MIIALYNGMCLMCIAVYFVVTVVCVINSMLAKQVIIYEASFYISTQISFHMNKLLVQNCTSKSLTTLYMHVAINA